MHRWRMRHSGRYDDGIHCQECHTGRAANSVAAALCAFATISPWNRLRSVSTPQSSPGRPTRRHERVPGRLRRPCCAPGRCPPRPGRSTTPPRSWTPGTPPARPRTRCSTGTRRRSGTCTSADMGCKGKGPGFSCTVVFLSLGYVHLLCVGRLFPLCITMKKCVHRL